ncbi:EmrB/QacA subfamily drug resistance transporter [Motilibacter peucedani]|uniref:EmrB/QacA subfamily drug resistance transporter n=1 Tax=Motilibacter peucedani TaxID=598650 RepID=A0A420XKS4_9ACTN|nr:DHA2 family efflux MFS transporter permease subunit [Motilibacter peucedani]RKS68508.1 EmrB/QacA subfamily drug resistance transporter [Motilibacter peucedani]
MQEDVAYAWRVLSVTSLGVVLTGLNSSTLDVGLPSVSRHFNASPTQASWFLLSYMLVNTVLILLFGRLADLVGRRRLYVTGLGVLTLGSLGCGLAPTAGVLIALRAVQAVGAAAIITNTTAQLTDAFPRRLLGTALGLNITVISAAQVAGPVVGGALIGAFGWRWVFLFNVPVGLVGLAWATHTLRPAGTERAEGRFDGVGAVLSVVWLGGLVVALSEGGSVGWAAPQVVAGFLALAVGLPAFVLVQRHRSDPLVDLALLADRQLAFAYLSVFLLAMARFSLILLASLFFQGAQGLDPLQAGLRVTPLALGMMVASPPVGWLSRHVSTQVLASSGLGVVSGGLLLMAAVVSPHAGYAPIGVALFLVGVGTGAFMTPNTSSIMSSVPASSRGVANGLRSMLQNTGFVVSTAMSLAIVTSPLAPREKRATYAGTLTQLSPAEVGHFVDGFRTALVVLTVLCVVAAGASLARGGAARATG